MHPTCVKIYADRNREPKKPPSTNPKSLLKIISVLRVSGGKKGKRINVVKRKNPKGKRVARGQAGGQEKKEIFYKSDDFRSLGLNERPLGVEKDRPSEANQQEGMLKEMEKKLRISTIDTRIRRPIRAVGRGGGGGERQFARENEVEGEKEHSSCFRDK